MNWENLNVKNDFVSCCGSPKKVKIYDPKTPVWESSWKCSKCGYQGYVVIEDLEKQIKDLRKMDKLSKKFLKRIKIYLPS